MSEFDPGPEWREVQYSADAEGRESLHWRETGLFKGGDRLWVREEPVLPLPTEPYTAIRVQWRSGAAGDSHDVLWRTGSSGWADREGVWSPAHELRERITGFEVLAEPVDHGTFGRGYEAGVRAADNATYAPQLRAEYGVALPDAKEVRRETAEAIVARIRTMPAGRVNPVHIADQIAREFGVADA